MDAKIVLITTIFIVVSIVNTISLMRVSYFTKKKRELMFSSELKIIYNFYIIKWKSMFILGMIVFGVFVLTVAVDIKQYISTVDFLRGFL